MHIRLTRTAPSSHIMRYRSRAHNLMSKKTESHSHLGLLLQSHQPLFLKILETIVVNFFVYIRFQVRLPLTAIQLEDRLASLCLRLLRGRLCIHGTSSKFITTAKKLQIPRHGSMHFLMYRELGKTVNLKN